MASRNEDDWDSDDGSIDEVQTSSSTSVLLGVPDGAIEEPGDLKDPLVSKIGGLPVSQIIVFHPHVLIMYQAFVKGILPPIESSICKHCSKQMELAIQMWCPRENSPMDRALYVWSCSRAGCQRKYGRYVLSYFTKFNVESSERKVFVHSAA